MSDPSHEESTESNESVDRDLSFPMKLMDILNKDIYEGIIEWLPQGDGFIIHDKQRCADEVLPVHFGAVSKYASFTRRLNRWNFIFQQKGNKKALYFHPLFTRGKPSLCLNMRPKPQKNYNHKHRRNKSGQHQLQVQESYAKEHGVSSFRPPLGPGVALGLPQGANQFPPVQSIRSSQDYNSVSYPWQSSTSSSSASLPAPPPQPYANQFLGANPSAYGAQVISTYHNTYYSNVPGMMPVGSQMHARSHPQFDDIVQGSQQYSSYKIPTYADTAGMFDNYVLPKEHLSHNVQHLLPPTAISSGHQSWVVSDPVRMGHDFYYAQQMYCPVNQAPIG